MLRRIVERVARRVVLKKRLPVEFGRRPFFVSPDAALAYLKPGLRDADELISVADHCVKNGQCVWDIGGNVGIFSFLAAARVGDTGAVVCVEPDPLLASMIQRSVLLKANRDRMIHVLCSAVSDEAGISRFLIAKRGRASNSLEKSGQRSQAGGTRYAQYVPTTTLDQMLDSFPSPQLVKVDVEGAEEYVLRGGTRLFRDIRPQLYIEVGPQQTLRVTKLLRDYGYTLFDGSRIGDGCQSVNTCTFNTLAVPAETVGNSNASRAA